MARMPARTPPTRTPDVAVIGFGYIGSVIAAVLAERGFSVVGIDTNARMIDAVKAGRCPIPEPGLDALVGKGVASGRLTASTDPAAAKGARAVLITVGTPLSDDYTADLAHIRAACASVAPHLHDGQIVMIKSTVPPGTTRADARGDHRPRPPRRGEGAHGLQPRAAGRGGGDPRALVDPDPGRRRRRRGGRGGGGLLARGAAASR